ncbi:MAG: type II toxin-antitoxin system HicB family antitoxin [Gemmatimonadota bacterium]
MHTVPDDCVDGTGCYVARIPELPGCESHGSTPEEAIANLREAQELYLQEMLERGLEPPLPETYDATFGGLTATWRVRTGQRCCVGRANHDRACLGPRRYRNLLIRLTPGPLAA